MTKATFESSALPYLCDVLMAGAHADDRLDGREVDAVKKLLGAFTRGGEGLPDNILGRIDAFDPKAFDLTATVAGLGELSREQKRAVLEMLSALSESDDEIDLVEDEFLRKVASAIGATSDELQGLTVEIEIVSRPVPPPLPKR